jgi:hypothetical protein
LEMSDAVHEIAEAGRLARERADHRPSFTTPKSEPR